MRLLSPRSAALRALAASLLFASLPLSLGCGARTGLLEEYASAVDAADADASDAEPDADAADTTPDVAPDVPDTLDTGCAEGTVRPCGSSVGACKPGIETCRKGVFSACENAIEPKLEACNGVDENCNGTINDCEPGAGSCTPTLTVTGSTPSSPGCIDFPVTTGGTGSITYICPGTGGTVTAVLGGVSFTGTVTGNVVRLDADTTTRPPMSPDGCTWQQHHHIEGTIQSGTLQYTYSEQVLVEPPGRNCWSPCTEDGTVAISWPMGI